METVQTMVFWRRRRKPVVLGQQLADARSTERKHRREHPANSPLAGHNYEPFEGNPFVLGFRSSPTDDIVRSFLESFAEYDDEVRDSARRGLTADDFYLLFAFANRCVAGAVSEGSQDRAVAGLEALSAMDADRMDFRDVHMAAGRLAWVLKWLGQPAEDRVRSAAERSEPRVAEILQATARRASPDPHESALHVVDGKGGRVLIDWEGSDYSPTKDLIEIAFDLSEVIDRDRYEVNRIQAATTLPAVWFRGYEPAAGTLYVDGVRGCALVDSSMDGVPPFEPDHQGLMLWLAECESQELAEQLEAAATYSDDAREAMGVRSGHLMAALIQSATYADKKPAEVSGGLERFRGAIEGRLAAA
jgi:hypothetical protein